MTVATSLVIAIVIVLIAIYIARHRSISRDRRLCDLFRLDPNEYQLLGTDLGGSRAKLFLRASGLSGVPDALFRHIPSGDIVVGEAKLRKHRGHVTDYERFQVTLYLGMAEIQFRSNVSGVLRFGCGTCVDIQSDSAVYDSLLALIPQYRAIVRRFPSHSARRQRRARS